MLWRPLHGAEAAGLRPPARREDEAAPHALRASQHRLGGGPYGVGKRISIKHTRALLDAALRGDLDEVATETHPVFNLRMPKSCPDVPAEILDPRNTWQDKAAYDAQAAKLRDMFRDNFEQKGFGKLGLEPVM
jgi:phosphoenolpyruvate carboxykinase (ATP)